MTTTIPAGHRRALAHPAATDREIAARVKLLWLLNMIGGMAVLGSYVLWLGGARDGAALWGSLAEPARTLYTASMLAAAAGYLVAFDFLVRRRVAELDATGFAALLTTFALVLFPSALWMPLALEHLDTRSTATWWAMRATLFLVAAASCALVAFIARSESRARGAALAGVLAFTFQTAVLDAFVWPVYFPG